MTVVVRTVTVGIGEPHPISDGALDRAVRVLSATADALTDAGFEVQTRRISTRPLFLDRLHARDTEIVNYAVSLQERCERRNIAYLSLGPVPADDPSLPLERIGLVAEMLAPNEALNASVQIASATHGLRSEAAVPTARVIRALARQTPDALGNLRFAMVANCPQRGPFFPAAFQPDSEWGISIGLQSANLVRDAVLEAVRDSRPGPTALKLIGARLVTALEREGRVIADLAMRAAQQQQMTYDGIDLSPAPNGNESIAAAIEAAGMGEFGQPGTVTVVAIITAALKNTALKTCGYNGIFLPVLEDAGIVRRLSTSGLSLASLLLYSSVCGAGLDTIPVPDDTPIESLAATLLDVATIASRQNKPLSARLMPIPGKRTGDLTAFSSPWLTNAPVMAV
jgi:uncharacterized protein (UPF0210 family)